MENIGKRVRERLELLNFSDENICTHLKINEKDLQKLYECNFLPLDIKSFVKLCTLLQCSASYLTSGKLTGFDMDMEIHRTYSSLDEFQRDKVKDLIKSLKR